MQGTIKSKREIERLFQEGRRSSSSYMTILACEVSPQNTGKCAFIAGKKLGTAPLRSRCKRVMRECARELGSPWAQYDVAFVARRKLAFASHASVLDKTRHQLTELGIM